MSAWILSVEGTESGHIIALCLAILAAFLHALFGAMQKGRHDPWLSRGVIDFGYGTIALAVALTFWRFPEPALWPIYGGVFAIHTVYKILQAQAYSRGAYTVVYPVVRGTGPVFTIIGAFFLFDEVFTLTQWLGVGVLLSGIFGLAIYNAIYLEAERDTFRTALILAVFTGVFVALYTTYDAYGIRKAIDPVTFLIWFFIVDGWFFPILAFRRWRKMAQRPAIGPLLLRGYSGAIVAFFSFGSIMLATRLDKVGEAAILRETSTVFAALIGWLVLKETVGPKRIFLMVLIAAGAIIVELGG
jgi:drug/metabolite transporter (DMT)-like permease